MSEIIDEKIVAGAKSPAAVKEDPIVVLTVNITKTKTELTTCDFNSLIDRMNTILSMSV